MKEIYLVSTYLPINLVVKRGEMITMLPAIACFNAHKYILILIRVPKYL